MPDIRHSVCALDCPDCCSVLVTVENGHATKLRGNPDHPVTRGFLCGNRTREGQALTTRAHGDPFASPYYTEDGYAIVDAVNKAPTTERPAAEHRAGLPGGRRIM